ncbi:type VI secretion system protein TssL, long form [Aliiruegeria sabulilitoris]|uniref:type VI secretion system protein TssL, long form n=1 Tax=Aliiruegeria sabulilitoris TaxID=1510458 RepID=UPI000837536E|nr:type VI secretion system protein TssL, long form [Aliiruegeria sabulilitoris]NDR59036.1 type VI secretion system protein TssL [Pseudoruegeria sp. M32A2M]
MASDDPFSEMEDNERTVIRPNPGGRRPPPAQPSAAPQAAPGGAPPQQSAPQPAQSAPASSFGVPSSSAPSGGGNAAEEAALLPQSFTGMNRLIACAAPLFALVSRISNRAQHADPDRLRQNVVGEVREFESRAHQAGCLDQDVKVARYAICATLDDVVLNTPWGENSSWSLQSMVATFHREVVGGDRFYDVLAHMEKDPPNNIELLEFLYMCMTLGFEGRLRADVDPNGPARHLEVRGGLARLIRNQRGPVEREISPHWKGLEVPNNPRSIWRPVWIAMSIAAVLLMLAFLAFTWALGGSTESVTGQISRLESNVPPTIDIKAPPPPPPPAPVVAVPEKFKEFLAEEIKEGLVEVLGNASTVTIRIKGAGMFASGSNVLLEKFHKPVNRLAEALNEEPGPIIVVGHSDSVPIRSSRYASNMELSLDRAKSVEKMIAAMLDNPRRLSAEGRADKEPIASNETKEGRAANRRIEVVLMRNEP